MKNNYYMCECKCGVLATDYDPSYGLEISFFQYQPNRSFKNRLRLAWNALCGRPYTDMVILNDQQIADFVDYLAEIQNL
jgi:hypothetical protein